MLVFLCYKNRMSSEKGSGLIRVSVATRCCIKIDNRYALVASLNDFRRGVRSLSPPGGGVKTTDLGRRYLATEMGAKNFEKDNDLRFRLSPAQLENFADWLENTSELEENAAAREFHDELVSERHLLTSEEARQVTFTPRQAPEAALPWVEMPMWSYLGGVLKLVNTYAFERIYDATVPAQVEARLAAAAGPEALLELVTAQEIRNGRSLYSTITN